MLGNLAASLAGHDRGKVYIIIGEEPEYVILSDGVLKPFDNPKKKNKKHIQVIKKGTDPELAARIKSGEKIRDEEIKRIIQLYEMKRDNQI